MRITRIFESIMRQRSFMVLALVAVLATAVSTCTDEEQASSDLMNVIDQFYDAIEAGDVETRIALLADDVVLMPNHWKMLRGKADVSESFRQSEGAVFRLRDREVVSIEISGDLAYTINSYYYTYHPRGEREQWHKTKNVHIWRRQGGQWKLAVDIWNSDVGLQEFEREGSSDS